MSFHFDFLLARSIDRFHFQALEFNNFVISTKTALSFTLSASFSPECQRIEVDGSGSSEYELCYQIYTQLSHVVRLSTIQ